MDQNSVLDTLGEANRKMSESKRCLIVASSRKRKKGKEKEKKKEKRKHNLSLKPFQTWLGENMERRNENVWVFFFFFMCSALFASYCQKILESQQCAMWNFKNKSCLARIQAACLKMRFSQCWHKPA